MTVISVQSDLMQAEMVKEHLLDGPINGLVNNTAHGWWKKKNSLLVMSLSHCPYLLCWVLGVISYTNRASAAHFKYHLLAVLQRIAHEAESKGYSVNDKLFLGVRDRFPCIFFFPDVQRFQVMDFSEAEHARFRLAFIEFWILHTDSRPHEELSEAAGHLLRGCEEHFRAGVT